MPEPVPVPEASSGSAGPQPDLPPQSPERKLIGRGTLVSLSLASFVPAVQFATVPLLIFSIAGPTAWVADLASMFATMCVAAAVVHFARRYIASGSLYSYVGTVFRPWARYLVGASLLGGYVMGVAALVTVVGIYMGSFLHSLGIETATDLVPLLGVGVVTVLVVTAIALFGRDTSIKAVVVLTAISLPLVLVIIGASIGHTGFDLSPSMDFGSFNLEATLRGAALGMAGLVGFESSSALAAETRDAKRSVPWAVMAPVLLIGGGVPAVLLLTMPGMLESGDALAAGSSAPAALAANAGLPIWIGQCSDLFLAIASLGSTLAFLNYASRLAQNLAGDGLLPAAMQKVDLRRGVPQIAIVAVAGVSLAWILVFSIALRNVFDMYSMTATLVIFLWVLPYIVIMLAAIVGTVRRREIRPMLWIASGFGAVAMGWVLIDGVRNAAPGVSSKMIYVMAFITVALIVVFRLSLRNRIGQRSVGLTAEKIGDLPLLESDGVTQ